MSLGLPASRAYRPKCFKMKRFNERYPPIITVGHPGGIIFPTGLGMGATQLVCAVMSFTLAAGIPPTRTVAEPITTVAGPPGTQPGSVHGVVVLPIWAAGWLPMSTVNAPVMIVTGRAGWGTGVGTGAGGWIGA
jgi:hypothetical protein